MEKLFALTLVAVCGAAAAQTPATNPMPDGSHDMYVGLGAVSAPRYEGASVRRVRALPVIQMEWSNGMFVSGLAAGMHLSQRPGVEYGPLLAVDLGRSESGSSSGAGGVTGSGTLLPTFDPGKNRLGAGQRLVGMGDIDARLQLGAFANVYLNPTLRVTNTVLFGAGKGRDGAVWRAGLQYMPGEIAPHHAVSLTAGATIVNRHYNQDYFGVNTQQAFNSGNLMFNPTGGVKDVYANARWNWTFSPSWLLTSTLQANRLTGDAGKSPLVERKTNVTVSTALAYRF
jgi:outer membrane protein